MNIKLRKDNLPLLVESVQNIGENEYLTDVEKNIVKMLFKDYMVLVASTSTYTTDVIEKIESELSDLYAQLIEEDEDGLISILDAINEREKELCEANQALLEYIDEHAAEIDSNENIEVLSHI